MIHLSELSNEERELLLKFPAYISLLAANHDGGIDSEEKKAAVKLSHIKTYACQPILAQYYNEADKYFEQNIDQLDAELPKEREQRKEAIHAALLKTEAVLAKLGKEYAEAMHTSMKSFKDHVSRAHNNVLEYVLFPMTYLNITGRSD